MNNNIESYMIYSVFHVSWKCEICGKSDPCKRLKNHIYDKHTRPKTRTNVGKDSGKKFII